MTKRILSIILVLCLAFSVLPTAAFADYEDEAVQTEIGQTPEQEPEQATGPDPEQVSEQTPEPETVPVSTLTLPIVDGDSEEDGGEVYLQELVDHEVHKVYYYEGTNSDSPSPSNRIHIIGATEEPAENGIVKVVSTDFASKTISYYYSEYDDSISGYTY